MLCMYASRFGNQWDHHLSGLFAMYRTGEKPLFLMFGVDLRTLKLCL